LLIYRIRASHIGLVQLQDKIVVRFALTIYPYSLELFPRTLILGCHSIVKMYK